MINRGKIREFQIVQLVRVLEEPFYKQYHFGMNRKREVVFIPDHEYLTRPELSLALELGHKLEQALELKHVGIAAVGADTITTRRMKRKEYLDDLEHIANLWSTDVDGSIAAGVRDSS